LRERESVEGRKKERWNVLGVWDLVKKETAKALLNLSKERMDNRKRWHNCRKRREKK
jgi:hypothetical protein